MKIVSGISVAWILGLALNAVGANGVDCAKPENFPDITKAELQTLVKENKVVTLDANSEKSFKKEAIAKDKDKAIHFDKNNKTAFIAKVKALPQDQMLVAYCGGPGCEAWQGAAQAACEAGYTNIKHFSAGIAGWKKN